MEETLTRLEELSAKFKKNSKLSKKDSSSVLVSMKIVFALESFWNKGYELLMSLPAEPGCQAFVDVWKQNDETAREKMVDSLLNYKEFNSVAGHNRLILLTKLFIPVCSTTSITILSELCNRLTTNGTRKPAKTYLNAFRRDLLNKNTLMKIPADMMILSPFQVESITAMLIFGLLSHRKDCFSDRSFLGPYLNWMATWQTRPKLTEKLVEDIEKVTAKLPKETQQSFKNLGLIRTVIYKKESQSDGVEKSVDSVMAAKDTDTVSQVVRKVQDRFDVHKHLKVLENYIADLEYNTQNLEQERAERNSLENKIAVKKQELENAVERINNLEKELNAAYSKIEELTAEIETLNQEHKAKVEELYEMLDRQSVLVVQQLKNKIAVDLRTDYLDLMQIEKEPMSASLGDNLRAQLKNIFRILEKEGINVKDMG